MPSQCFCSADNVANLTNKLWRTKMRSYSRPLEIMLKSFEVYPKRIFSRIDLGFKFQTCFAASSQNAVFWPKQFLCLIIFRWMDERTNMYAWYWLTNPNRFNGKWPVLHSVRCIKRYFITLMMKSRSTEAFGLHFSQRCIFC